jgi:hypothetical protein
VTEQGRSRTRLQRAAVLAYTKSVGREQVMDALRRAADQARAGHGQMVAVVPEAGASKRILFFEFKAKNQSEWIVLESFGLTRQGQPPMGQSRFVLLPNL